MADSLRQKTVHALMWSFFQAIAQRSVQFIVGVVLARLLFPDQFGLVGMLAIFIAVIRAFLDSGFGAALIQKREVSQSDICSIFYFNIVMGGVAVGLLWFAAPWIASFYHQPVLTHLTRALSLTIVIDSFGLIHSTLLTKEINFKAHTKISVIAGILSGIAGITLALRGYGVWSLVFQQITASLVSTVCLWSFNHWRPELIFSFDALAGMFGFGSRLLFSSILNQIFDNIYYIVIGKIYSAADLGFFSRAKTLNDVPTLTLSEMAGRVTFPVFSKIQDDRERLKRGVKKALTSLVLVNFPMMIGLAVIARPLVLVLLTEKWAAAIPYLQLLCIAGVLYPLHVVNLNLLQALGRSDLFLRLEVIKKMLIVINIAVTWSWGISAMIYGMIGLSVISYYLNSYYTGILIGYSFGEQVADLGPYLAVGVLMGLVVSAVGWLAYPGNVSMLLVQIAAGVISYASICRLLRLTAFMEIWRGLWDRMPDTRFGTLR